MTLCEWCEEPVDAHTPDGLAACLAKLHEHAGPLEGEAAVAKVREVREALRAARRSA